MTNARVEPIIVARRIAGKGSVFALLTSFLAILFLAADSPTDSTDDHWERLRSMSRDQRLLLVEKLKQFDGLDRGEQEQIRNLDDALQKMPPQNREAAYSVLRRYHLWFQSLSEAEQAELNTLPANRRMERVRGLQASQKQSTSELPIELHPTVYGAQSPYDMATQVRTWLALAPERKTALLNSKDSERAAKLNEYRKELKIQPVARPELTDADKLYAAERWKEFRNRFNLPALKKFDDPDNAEFQEKKARRLRRIAENRKFETRPVEKVRTDRLTEFAFAMPPWLRSLFDRLSPEVARQQLTLLYRLVFPSPLEFVPPKPPTKGAVPGKGDEAKKKPASPPAKPPGPPVNSQPF